MTEFKSYTVKLDTALDAKIIEAIETDGSGNRSKYIRDQLSISLGMEPRRDEIQQVSTGGGDVAAYAALQAMALAILQLRKSVEAIQPQTDNLTPELFAQGIEYLADKFATAVSSITVNPPAITINMPTSGTSHHDGNGYTPEETEQKPPPPKAKRPVLKLVEDNDEAPREPTPDELEAASNNFLSQFG